MKRPKLFLGLTTGLLAIAGLVAAKNAKFNDVQYCYFTQPSNSGNTDVPTGKHVFGTVVKVGSAVAFTTGGSNHNNLFTASQCLHKLYSGGE